MPKFVSARDANQGFSALLNRAANGERVVITRRGEPVAELLPYGEAPDRTDTDQAWERLLRRLKEGLHLGGEKFDRDSLYDR